MIKEGQTIKFNYTLNVDGSIVDSSKGQPFEYTHGQTHILSGLQDALTKMSVDEERDVVLEPSDAYGPISQQLFKKVPRTSIPQEIIPEVGMRLKIQKEGQKAQVGTIDEIGAESVVLNFNHPLAGKTLNFNIKVVDITN
jgi:FKBP-type peptidyl-prolyl cis-trans isomerase SlyD